MTREVVSEMVSTEHPDVALLAALAATSATSEVPPDIALHLATCSLCEIHIERLRNFQVEPPSASDLATLAAAAPTIPGVFVEALVAPRHPAPLSGDLWRAGTSSASLVWIRRVLADVLVVLPVMLDSDLADEETLIVPATASPLGTELAVFTALEWHIDPSALLHRYGVLDIEADVDEIRKARSASRVPLGVEVGAPVLTGDDQRLEFRRAVAGHVASMSPEAMGSEVDDPLDPTGGGAVDIIGLREHFEQLVTWRQCRYQLLDGTPLCTTASHFLVPAAFVAELDTVVLVLVLIGPDPAGQVSSLEVAAACQELRLSYPQADDIAIAMPGAEWPAVLVTGARACHAIETPSGAWTGPQIPTQTMPLVDLLHKHLELHTSPFDIDEPVELPAGSDVDVLAVADSATSAALQEVKREGQRALRARHQGYAQLDERNASERISSLVGQLVGGSDPADAVREFLDGPLP